MIGCVVAAQEKMDEFVEILKVVDAPVWLILRNNNLLRSINQDLGVPVNRFLIMARQAVRGLHTQVDEEKVVGWSSSLAQQTRATVSRIQFEVRLAAFLLSYWLFDMFLTVLIKLGRVKEVELEDLVKAA